MVVDQNVSFLYSVDVWTLHFLPDYNVCLFFSPDMLHGNFILCQPTLTPID